MAMPFWTPEFESSSFAPVGSLLQDFERLQRNLFSTLGMQEPTMPLLQGPTTAMTGAPGGDVKALQTMQWRPRLDVYESGDALNVVVEIPGMKKEDINVSLENDMLRITGTRNVEFEMHGPEMKEGLKEREREREQHRVIRRERQFGQFTRVISLPPNTDPKQLECCYCDGVLRIVIHKTRDQQQQVYQIPIIEKHEHGQTQERNVPLQQQPQRGMPVQQQPGARMPEQRMQM